MFAFVGLSTNLDEILERLDDMTTATNDWIWVMIRITIWIWECFNGIFTTARRSQ